MATSAFGKSFEKSFQTGFSAGSSVALEGIKEKIKQDNEQRQSDTIIDSIKERIINSGSGDAESQIEVLDKLKKAKLSPTELMSAAKMSIPMLGSEGGQSKGAFVVQQKDDGSYQLTDAISGKIIKDASEIPGGASIFKETLTPDQIAQRTTAKETASYSGPKSSAERAFQLRSEFQGIPLVKETQTIIGQVGAMEALVNSSQYDDETKNSNLAKDQGVITLFNKVTDPTSVVRESEYERTPKNLSLANRFAGAFEKLKKGGAGLTQADRESLLFGAKVIADSRIGQYNNVVSNYETLSTKFGLEPDLVVGGYKKADRFITNPSGNTSNNKSDNKVDLEGLFK